ncbi:MULTISPECIES: HD domain-containing protein [Nocardia]|uniref:Metal-dependent phosphohydrolase, HD subdomain protein n=1 Tax=Nocardia sputorum TaxID=2984338 RepID=A0ABN6TXV4_9NOCA|nr:HD domain-containing protein [Nocardia sputorum]BDT97718.1 metal-dependent phosphohydrolase, HD subdomain protein [Nocardia sputorum]
MTDVGTAEWAEKLARKHLASLTLRLAHVEGVVRQAERASRVVDDPILLVAAAWLHDIGYAPNIRRTGFHPVDGAEFLHQIGVDDRLCGLVANHSCACVEARRRGVRIVWPDEQSALRDALWWADMTTTPMGDVTGVRERIAEVQERYGPEHVVTQSVAEAAPVLFGAVNRTEGRLEHSSPLR